MASFDLLIRRGTLVDGTGTPGRPADVGIIGDQILAIGDLSGLDSGGADRHRRRGQRVSASR